MIDTLFTNIKNHLINSAWFIRWLESKPSGELIIKVNINQGGIRGRPKIIITENI